METRQYDCIAWEAYLDLKTQNGATFIKLFTAVSYEFSQ